MKRENLKRANNIVASLDIFDRVLNKKNFNGFASCEFNLLLDSIGFDNVSQIIKARKEELEKELATL